MGKPVVYDFKKYVKEKYNCDISIKKSANPNTFDNVFNGNFINTDLMIDKILDEQDFTDKVEAIPIIKIAKILDLPYTKLLICLKVCLEIYL